MQKATLFALFMSVLILISFKSNSMDLIKTTPILSQELLETITDYLHLIAGSPASKLRLQKIALSPDLTKVAVLDSTGTISLWDTTSNTPIDSFLATNQSNTNSLKFDFTGNRVITTTSTEGRVYDIINPKVLQTITAHITSKHLFTKLKKKVVSPDRKKIATLDSTGAISIWNALTGEPLQENIEKYISILNPSRISFSPDSAQLIITQGAEEIAHPLTRSSS